MLGALVSNALAGFGGTPRALAEFVDSHHADEPFDFESFEFVGRPFTGPITPSRQLHCRDLLDVNTCMTKRDQCAPLRDR